MNLIVAMKALKKQSSTSRGREFNVVDFTEANRKDGGGQAMVAEPV